MPDASPTKWHLAHTTWFFETFVLRAACAGLSRLRSGLRVSLQFLLRGRRPASSAAAARPALAARRRGDHGLSPARHDADGRAARAAATSDVDAIVELGLHHEQQHQELILMDIKHMLSLNPLCPAYAPARAAAWPRPRRWPGSTSTAGWSRSATTARASPSTTKGRAIASGWSRSRSRRGRPTAASISPSSRTAAIGGRSSGCRRDGTASTSAAGGAALLGAGRRELARVHAVGPAAAASPPSRSAMSASIEAEAFAKWAGKRLPREAEWEAARLGAARTPATSGNGPPAPTSPIPAIASRPARSANTTASSWPTRWCCAAAAPRRPPTISAPTYRNFFPPDARWMFGGIRLAEDLR